MDLNAIFNSFETDVSNMELNLSIDCVIFTIQEDKLKVLLTKLFPQLSWMLPGGFMKKQEEADTAANRILFQRTGVENVYLHQFKIFSNPDRFSFQPIIKQMKSLPNVNVNLANLPERVISIGYFALVDYTSIQLTGGLFHETTTWADVNQIPDMMFDHTEIIHDAVESLRQELFIKPIAYNLLPEKFTMPELQKQYEIILGKPIERSSFQKKMLKWNIYKRLDERREGVAHKRPFLYSFDGMKYDIAINQGIRFGI
jgi:ADP-ribose pyrophosphatase YjhB (NUDIX family)